MRPRSVPNKTMGLENTDGKEWTSFPESFTQAQPLLWSTEAGDVAAATRGRHDAVAGAPGVVVICLGT